MATGPVGERALGPIERGRGPVARGRGSFRPWFFARVAGLGIARALAPCLAAGRM